MSKVKKKEVIEFLFLFLFFFVFQKFVMTGGRVPSSSMEPTILRGDFLIKRVYASGGTTPQTLLSIPLLPPRVFGIKTYLSWIQLPSFRMSSLESIKEGDICTFRCVMGKTEEYQRGEEAPPLDCRGDWIKRVGGTRGRSIRLEEGFLYQMDEEGRWRMDGSHKCRQYVFDVWLSGRLDDVFLNKYTTVETGQRFMGQDARKYHYRFIIKYDDVKVYFSVLQRARLEQFRQDSGAKGVKYVKIKRGEMPVERHKGADCYFSFSSVVVPYKGLKISLDKSTHPLYIKTLENSVDGFHVVAKGGAKRFVLHGAEIKEYVFKEDYLYMQGDNFSNSEDGRFFGFLPESHITAKVDRVLFNWKKLSRWFKRLS